MENNCNNFSIYNMLIDKINNLIFFNYNVILKLSDKNIIINFHFIHV